MRAKHFNQIFGYLAIIFVMVPPLLAYPNSKPADMLESNSPFLKEPLLAQTNQNTFSYRTDSYVTLIGRWMRGSCYAVSVQGNIAFLGTYSDDEFKMELVDIFDPVRSI